LFLSSLTWASHFRFNEFGEDGGPTTELWAKKLTIVEKSINGIIGKNDLHIDARTFVAVCITLQGLGGLLFVLGSNIGAFFLILYLLFTTPLLYDFYHYDVGEPKFCKLLHEFLQCAALLGGLLFFIGMKNNISRRQLKKKNPKSKTA
ncbi:hypothetical protein PHJA_000723800, partial [Phtheirospermum japonicum]